MTNRASSRLLQHNRRGAASHGPMLGGGLSRRPKWVERDRRADRV